MGNLSPFRNTPFGHGFFGRQQPNQMPDRRYVQEGQGSGVIISFDGHVLANSHVVNDTGEVNVILADGRPFAAEVIGTDPRTDVAVIKIDSEALHAARLGDSDELRVGQRLIFLQLRD